MKKNAENMPLSLVSYVIRLTNWFDALDKEFGGHRHESNHDQECNETDPGVYFRFCQRELAFFLLQSLWGIWMGSKRVLVTRWVVEEDPRAYIAVVRQLAH